MLKFMKISVKTLFISVVALLLIADMSFAREYKARKIIAAYTIEMSIDRNPPIVDKNTLSLEIKDPFGKHVTDAKVLVNYYMPPMPGMPPMNYKTLAKLSGKKYVIIMDLIMSGPWNIVIKISRAGKIETVRFSIDVR
ncbi:MAG: FixH family protein [Thermodesulfovibrionales bacterium]|nr:FixH family protein [Thermodesulfovibrionales bacterium]